MKTTLHVLVAEDVAINQKVIRAILEKAGHTLRLADTGRAALAAYDAEAFDAVLMDVQMPEMDGLEATAAIRAREGRTGRHTPILGVSAHADRATCLKAGMDGHIAKPVRPHELLQVLLKAVAGSKAVSAQEQAEVTEEVVLDSVTLLDRLGDDRELLCEVVGLFLDDCPLWLEEIHNSIVRREAEPLRTAAHRMLGTVSTLAAPAAAAAAERLEDMGRTGDLDGADAAYDALVRALDRLRPALIRLSLGNLVQEGPPR
jgi:CheY-like chemotaxis protein/HPt (histidine-containing phosphotransfer) domain-containing protein